jgi:hypothetical protein
VLTHEEWAASVGTSHLECSLARQASARCRAALEHEHA